MTRKGPAQSVGPFFLCGSRFYRIWYYVRIRMNDIEYAKWYRYATGDKCGKCSKPITRYNTSGLCQSCKMVGNNKPALARWKGHVKALHGQGKARGERHYMWKGDAVGYNSLHRWVRRHLPQPELCEQCKAAPPLDLANKGIYNRDFKNWEYLCRRCHVISDGRLAKFIALGRIALSNRR